MSIKEQITKMIETLTAALNADYNAQQTALETAINTAVATEQYMMKYATQVFQKTGKTVQQTDDGFITRLQRIRRAQDACTNELVFGYCEVDVVIRHLNNIVSE